jgi:hypothetical protein
VSVAPESGASFEDLQAPWVDAALTTLGMPKGGQAAAPSPANSSLDTDQA